MALHDTMQDFTSLTKMTDLCQRICSSLKEYNTVMGRWKKSRRINFQFNVWSIEWELCRSFPVDQEQSFLPSRSVRFFPAETVAVVRQFLSAVSVSSYHTDYVRGSNCLTLENCELKTICVSEICGKCVLKQNLDGTFSASFVSEGFEHN